MDCNLPFLVWITGLSGSGKTTIGKELYAQIKSKYENTFFLDGDSFREIFGNNLGYDLKSRFDTALKISNLCKALVDQNINVICSTISLFKEIHQINRKNVKNYYEVFLEVDFDEIKRRDQKNIYSNAIKGETKNVIGVDLPYDKPIKPHLIIDNNNLNDLNNKVISIINLISKES